MVWFQAFPLDLLSMESVKSFAKQVLDTFSWNFPFRLFDFAWFNILFRCFSLVSLWMCWSTTQALCLDQGKRLQRWHFLLLQNYLFFSAMLWQENILSGLWEPAVHQLPWPLPSFPPTPSCPCQSWRKRQTCESGNILALFTIWH